MITVTISSQNQVVIPKPLRKYLGINPGDKLIVSTENQKVVLKPMGKSITEQLAGSIKITNEKRNIPFDKVIAVTKKRVAQGLAKE